MELLAQMLMAVATMEEKEEEELSMEAWLLAGQAVALLQTIPQMEPLVVEEQAVLVFL
jgi:hypothetical protein